MEHWGSKVRSSYNQMKEKTGIEYLEFDCVIKKVKDTTDCKKKKVKYGACLKSEKKKYDGCMRGAEKVRAKKLMKRAM